MVTLFICAGALWSIWKSRNEMVFNKKVLSSPVELVYKTLMLTKTWRPILKPKLDFGSGCGVVVDNIYKMLLEGLGVQ